MTQPAAGPQPRVYRDTANHTGWRTVFSPADGAMDLLTYARLVFAPGATSHRMDTGGDEWVLFCIRGGVEVRAGDNAFTAGAHDMVYLPRNTAVELRGDPGTDVALGGCPADRDTRPRLVRYADVAGDPARTFEAGSADNGTRRVVHNMVADNVDASRMLAGFTVGDPTAWTSWPPHEHTATKEEFYLFFDMPPPASSVQFVYTSPDDVGFREVVREGDCVTIPGGYHPNAAMPGTRTRFLWVMAARNPATDRDYRRGVNVQPEFTGVKFL